MPKTATSSETEPVSERFRKAAAAVSCALGSPAAFVGALLLIVALGVAGAFVEYSADWQTLIGTGTGIGSFLMLFLLQNSQNRDTKAIHIKLDELLRAIEGARTHLANVGDLPDEELEKLEGEFRSLATHDQAAAETSGVEGRGPA